MVRFNTRLCLGLVPATVVAASSALGHAGHRSTYYHCYRRRPSVAFGWSSRLSSGDSAGERPTSPKPLQSAVKSSSVARPQELAAAPSSLLASVEAVASDVDGTLTTQHSTVSKRTVAAVKAVLDSEVLFFPATGKVRSGNRVAFRSGGMTCFCFCGGCGEDSGLSSHL